MSTRPNSTILNQSVDLVFGELDEKKFGEFTSRYRKTIFDDESLMLREARDKIIGIHTEGNGAGTSLVQKEETWVLNFGFSSMSFVEIGDMLSIFQPLEEMLKELCEEVGLLLHYKQENNGSSSKACSSFLKEIILTPPAALVDDKTQRLFQIRKDKDCTLYIFKSLNGGLSHLDDCAALIQNERINAEEIFIPSLSHWLDSIKTPKLISSQNQDATHFGELSEKQKLVH